jgi:serralysin
MSTHLRAWTRFLSWIRVVRCEVNRKLGYSRAAHSRPSARSPRRHSCALECLQPRLALSVSHSYNAGTDALVITGDGANDTITVTVDGANNLSLVLNGSPVYTFNGSTVASSRVQSISIDGGGGTDTIVLTDVNTTEGFSSIKLDNDVTLAGGAGNDSITASAFADWIRGGDGDDVILAGSGGDTIYGDEGGDTMTGGSGDDTYVWQGYESNGSYYTDEVIESGSGNDTLDFYAYGNAVNLNLGTTGSAQSVQGYMSIKLTNAGQIENVIGSNSHGDNITGDSINNLIRGSGGNDTLAGGSGSDTIYGDEGGDVMTGGSGDDTYVWQGYESNGSSYTDEVIESGGGGNDTLDFYAYGNSVNLNLSTTGSAQAVQGWMSIKLTNAGQIENVIGSNSYGDNITGDSINNIIRGSGGNDTLSGGSGDDTIYGGRGSDSLTGGSGNDTYVWTADDIEVQTDQIIEADNTDTDTLDFSQYGNSVAIDLSSTATQVTSPGSNVQYQLSSSTGIENVVTGAGYDTVIGNTRNNSITLGNGNNVAYGGDGNDVILAGSGNDVINGGTGGDTMTGGAGDDTYVWQGYESNGSYYTDEVVESAYGGNDTLDFSAYGNGVNLNLSVTGTAQSVQGWMSIKLTNAGQIENVNGSNSHGDNITGDALANTIRGGGGNDVINGGAGNDTLYGDDGDDTLNGGSDTDTGFGGAGTDSQTSIEIWTP